MTELRRAAFLDRDGVINRENGYVYRIADFEILPGVVGALQRLQAADYALVVVTNQSGIARGVFDESAYATITQHLRDTLAADGVALDGIYHCPHLTDAKLVQFRRDCDCRKPLPGLLLRAIADHDINPAVSLLVGDKYSDIAAGRAAEVGRCYLVGAKLGQVGDCSPDGAYPDLAACVAAVT